MPLWPERQRAAIDWVEKNAGKGNYTHIDPKRIAAWGMSCGGIETYGNWNDSRVSSIGIFNSGYQNGSMEDAKVITKPVFFFEGGLTDMAAGNVRHTLGLI